MQPNDDLKNNKINYQEKNLNFIERLKEKKKRQALEKYQLEQRINQRRQHLKRKILQQAAQIRQIKLKDLKNSYGYIQEPNQHANITSNMNSISLSKQTKSKTAATKPNLEEHRQEKIDSKTNFFRIRKESTQSVRKRSIQERSRSKSAQKTSSLIEIAQNEFPKTNNFKRKNQQILQKIKRRREQQNQSKQQVQIRKEKLKEKLKDYVMNTVKKNVLDGLYDDQFDKKPKKMPRKQQGVNDALETEQEQKDPTIRKKRKMRNFPHVNDLVEWKKKNRLENGQKVFIVTGGYAELKRALRERGWVQNPNCHSPCFDMKFTLQGKQIDYSNLLDFQMVNHYQKNSVITTKLGLTKSLRNSVWVNDISQDSFYPKCFDLNDQGDYFAFQTHFKVCKALSILKIYADSSTVRNGNKAKQQKALIQELKLRTSVAISVCSKTLEDFDNIIDRKKYPQIVTQKEWQILASDELNQKSLAKKKHQQWIKSIDEKFGGANSTSKNLQKTKKRQSKQQNIENQQGTFLFQSLQKETDDLLEKVQQILSQYKKRFPHQYNLTGHNNIWILKPAGLSRGRGITCYNNFIEIEDHVKCKQSLWIAQKYIQNPLVILKRKFDIRQWVLITDFNPLTIWMYTQCYVRFSAIDYDPKQVSNKFIHLTNNSIGAYYKDFDKSNIKGNMFFQDQCRDYLQEKQGYDVFEQKIQPQMKEIIIKSMLCSLETMQNRKNTYQLFGYDFMIDEDFKVWLIQINSSPSMDYSTHVTTKLVKEVLHDLVKVIVDYADAPKKQKKQVDTGKFKRIYKGVEVSQKAVTGINLCLQGIPMRKNKKIVLKPHTYSLQTK